MVTIKSSVISFLMFYNIRFCLCFIYSSRLLSSLQPTDSFYNHTQDQDRQDRRHNWHRINNGYQSNLSQPSKSKKQTAKVSALPVIVMSLHALRNDQWYIWTLISASSTIGILAEKTKVGAVLSSPLVTMGISLILCNIGLIPAKSPVYSIVMKILVPLAVPLLLLDADIRKCLKYTGTLLKAFIIGSIGSILGTFMAYLLVPMRSIAGSPLIASAICARHIGGAVNFVAVADILKISPDLVAAALAADNVIVAFYFAFLFAISIPSTLEHPHKKPSDQISTPTTNNSIEIDVIKIDSEMKVEEKTASSSSASPRTFNEVSIATISSALTLALALTLLSNISSQLLQGISPLLLVSLLAVAYATIFPNLSNSISQSGGILGVIFMQLFFSVTGAMGHIPTVFRIAPALFVHSFVQISIHFLFTILVGRRLQIPFKELLLASNANVGGPTTAAAMASNKKWNALILPSLLTGVFGYAIATAVGVIMSKLLLRLPA